MPAVVPTDGATIWLLVEPSLTWQPIDCGGPETDADLSSYRTVGRSGPSSSRHSLTYSFEAQGEIAVAYVYAKFAARWNSAATAEDRHYRRNTPLVRWLDSAIPAGSPHDYSGASGGTLVPNLVFVDTEGETPPGTTSATTDLMCEVVFEIRQSGVAVVATCQNMEFDLTATIYSPSPSNSPTLPSMDVYEVRLLDADYQSVDCGVPFGFDMRRRASVTWIY